MEKGGQQKSFLCTTFFVSRTGFCKTLSVHYPSVMNVPFPAPNTEDYFAPRRETGGRVPTCRLGPASTRALASG